MSSEFSPDEKIYTVDAQRQYSMHDLLDYFRQHGEMRVSDLHLKVGCPPAYRIDGRLQKMKGPDLTAEQVSKLTQSLLADEDWDLARFEARELAAYLEGCRRFAARFG